MTGMNPYIFAALVAILITVMSIAMGLIAAAIDSKCPTIRTSLLVAVAYAAGICTALVVIIIRTS